MAVKKEGAVESGSDTKKLIQSMEKLTQRVDSLVEIFEEASKHLSDVESTEAKVAALANKLDALIEQNKSIARGLVLLEKYVSGRTRLEGTTPSGSHVSEFGGI